MTGDVAIEIGAVPPPLERVIRQVDMVAYAGATWDWHRLHYDETYVREHELSTPVVDGQMFGALLAEHAQDWLGPNYAIERMSFRFSTMVFAGQTIRITGEVTDVDDVAERITIVQQLTADGQVAVSDASAVVGRHR